MPIPVLWTPGCLTTQSDDFIHFILPKNRKKTLQMNKTNTNNFSVMVNSVIHEQNPLHNI